MLELIGRANAQVTLPSLQFYTNTNQTVTGFIGMILTWFLVVAGAIAVVYLVYGGVLYITAGGDAEKAKSGRTAVINAVIGIVIIALAIMIVTWVRNLATGNAT